MKLGDLLNNRRVVPYIFISPFFLIWAIFGAFPVSYSIWLSLHKWESIAKMKYVGFSNFIEIFHRAESLAAYHNVFWYVLAGIIILIPVSLLLAVLLNMAFLRSKNILRAAFFLPNLTSQVALSIIFAILLGAGGLVNSLLHQDIPWLSSTLWSKPAVIIAGIWGSMGFWMVIFLAALHNIPLDLYEAADIDGANSFRKFLCITIPQIFPVLVFVIIMVTIGTLQSFAIPQLLTGGGPLYSSTTPVLELYNTAFLNFEMGYGAAFGWLLAVAIIAIAIAQIIIARRTGKI